MAALQSRALAAAGYDVLQIDLLGCGDSSGDFADASWQAWREDVLLAHRWLRTRTQAPLTLWGLRAGCLLAANAAVDVPESTNFIFWQPVVSGKQHWQQFMRLKMASELGSGQTKGITEQLKQTLADGKSVEIAGYTVAPDLAYGLERSELALPDNTGRVYWFELSSRPEAELTPAGQKRIHDWQAVGIEVHAQVVTGPTFWQTTEIEDAPALIDTTLTSLASRA